MNNLIVNINKLPIELQKKICIYTWRLYWRNYIPLTAKIPSWYNNKVSVENILFQSKLKNIHFLHLPFNILPENKEWIMGCRCSYCKNYKNKKYKRREYSKQFEDERYFESIMPHSDFNINKEFYLDPNNDSIKRMNYDPLCGSAYEDYYRYAIRTNKIKLKFEEC
tara:strand:- start:312 stop:809 length:498 start_codon:yes stop_codon:yes gene_type:complete